MRWGKFHNHQRMTQNMERDKERYNDMINGDRKSPLETSLFSQIVVWIFCVFLVGAVLYLILMY